MRTALHPYTNTQISVAGYIKDFGNDNITQEERALCPICKQRMSLVAPSTPNSEGHFAHLPRSGFCPTKAKAGNPYSGLLPKYPDIEAATLAKKEFFSQWEKHFHKLSSLVIGLDVKEFIDVLKLSMKEHIWEYAALQQLHLPYIFATMMDYPPAKSYKRNGVPIRKYWFRCWFDSDVTCYDDLWIRRTTPLGFWRGSYNLPAGKRKPSIEDLVRCYELEMTHEFLEDTKSTLPKSIVDKVNKFILSFLLAED